jgi:2-keto-3-deoxy-L-rhamnonate aldolase RhmA
MEGRVDPAIDAFSAFVDATAEAGALIKSPYPHLSHPLSVKTPKIAPPINKPATSNSGVPGRDNSGVPDVPDPTLYLSNISRQLNTGVSAVVFVGVESAKEVEQGLAAMRFKSHGGTRPDDVGNAPKYWGMTEAEYKDKADVWPLNAKGELVNWTIVESKEGLAHVREIAAVKGISVLFPGAGTLRGVFSGDPEGWENAIQQVLAACKEFHLYCGYPANASDVELRMKQGFNLFVVNWGDAGFQTIEIGRKAGGRN